MAVFLAWLIPGGGHWYSGDKIRALLFFILIMAIYFSGMYIGNFENVSVTQPYYLCAQIFAGLPTIVIGILSYHKNSPRLIPTFFEIGNLYTCTASLLNLMIILNIYFI